MEGGMHFLSLPAKGENNLFGQISQKLKTIVILLQELCASARIRATLGKQGQFPRLID